MEFAPTCPTCRRQVAWEGNRFRPFCSERCRVIDLGAWASERYRVPAESVDAEADDESGSDEGGSA